MHHFKHRSGNLKRFFYLTRDFLGLNYFEDKIGSHKLSHQCPLSASVEYFWHSDNLYLIRGLKESMILSNRVHQRSYSKVKTD